MTKSHCMRSNSPAVPLAAVSVLHIVSAVICHDSRRRAHDCGQLSSNCVQLHLEEGIYVYCLCFFFLLFLFLFSFFCCLVVLFRFSVFWLFSFYPILLLSARACGLRPSTLPAAIHRVLGRSTNSTFLPATACFAATWPVCHASLCSPGLGAVRPVYSTSV